MAEYIMYGCGNVVMDGGVVAGSGKTKGKRNAW